MTRPQAEPAGARFITAHGYADCVELTAGPSRVVVGGAGGRVLRFSLHGIEAMHQDPEYDGFTAADATGERTIRHLPGGRFDVGPELATPPRPALWAGPWQATLTGDAARLTSATDPATGLQLERDFVLAADSATLRCTQTIYNRGTASRPVAHWSRTFSPGGGLVVTPVNPHGRYPEGYAVYIGPSEVTYRPSADPAIQRLDDTLLFDGKPARSKYVFDSSEGWLAYYTPDDLLFLKTFPVDLSQRYAEMLSSTVALWFMPDGSVVELEPLGPLVNLAPGASTRFSEVWSLRPAPHPRPADVDPAALRALAAKQERDFPSTESRPH